MLVVTDLIGQSEPLTGFTKLIRKRRVNGERTIRFSLFSLPQNEYAYPLLREESLIELNGEEYRIKYVNEYLNGKSLVKEVEANHTFFDLINSRIYSFITGSKSLQEVLDFIFKDTSYTFTIIGNFPNQTWEKFGEDNRLSLLQDALESYGVEFERNGTHLTFKGEIGAKLDVQFRYSHNIKTISHKTDSNDLTTYIKGFGKDGLEVEYLSPLHETYGIQEAPEVRDERYTIAESLLERIKKDINDKPKLSITVDYLDLRRNGYPYEVVNEGDYILLIHEPLNIDLEARIVEIEEEFNLMLETINTKVTLSNYSDNTSNDFVAFSKTQKALNSILDGSKKLPYSVLDDAVKRATELLLGSTTEIEYTNLGIIARSKDNPNHLVLVSSSGIGVSVDNGQTFRQAITAEGIVADLITVGTMLFDRIKGGTLTLGGELNGNGKLQVLDENGEIIADLDAGNGGFEWLRIGDVISDSVVKTNLSNLTFYIDPINGDDENNGLSINSKKKTIQNCIDSIPKFNAGMINIICDNATIKENIIVTGFIGDGYIIVDLQSGQLDGNLKIMSNMNRVDFKNGVINSANETYATVYVSKTTQSAMSNLKLYCRNGTSYGFSAVDNTFMQVIGCEIYDTNNCIRSGHGSNVFVQNCKGLGDYGVVADYVGAIGGEGTAPVGTISNTRALYGGEVRNTFTHNSGERALPTPPAPPPAPDVTNTWSASSADNYAMGTYGWVSEGIPKQGNYGYGRRKGLWFFGTSVYDTVNGRNIKRVRVYIKRKASGGSSSKTTIQIRSHTYASKPGGEPTLSSAYKNVSLSWGEGVWVDLPSDFITAFKSGGARGIGVYVASDSSSYYALMDSAAKIEVTYS